MAERTLKVLVTGSAGFVGKNLCVTLRERPGVELFEHDLGGDPQRLATALREVDVVFHLAGVNRPQHAEEFQAGNAGSTAELCRALEAAERTPKVVLTSSIQVERENPYGASKLAAERELAAWSGRSGGEAVVYRLKNLFGKWCRPNYNSVTATFCHNIAHGLPVQISDPATVVDLTYVDDVVAAFVAELDVAAVAGFRLAPPLESHQLTLGKLARTIESFRDHRKTLQLPDYSDRFVRALYATYLSYLETNQFGYGLDIKADQRGSLAEFVKSPHFGQLFVSRTKPGVTRGHHFHHTKTEKFLVVQGEAVIRFRQISGDEVIEYRVRGEDYRVVDIPPGYTHSIENVGTGELVTLFWSSEVFDPAVPDTFRAPVTP